MTQLRLLTTSNEINFMDMALQVTPRSRQGHATIQAIRLYLTNKEA